MAGGKGKSHGGKAGPKPTDGQRTQVSHSAKAGLQVRVMFCCIHENGSSELFKSVGDQIQSLTTFGIYK